MRKFVLSVAAAGAAMIAASPAAAQYYPVPPTYGPYSNGYNNWSQVRNLQARVSRVEWQISRLDRRDQIRGRSADRLLGEAYRIDRRLRDKARNGLDPREANEISYRIQRLEQQVQFAMANNYGRYGDRDDRRGRRDD